MRRRMPGLDCIVIGGGFAGLSCALVLARHRRHVVVVTNGPPRNSAARGIHGFIGQEGILPQELLRNASMEAAKAGASFFDGRVERVVRDGEGFLVSFRDRCLEAQRVVLAYGVVDQLPSIPGSEELYGKGIFHCPACDGYEVRDKELAAYGPGEKAAALALELWPWSQSITVLTNGTADKIGTRDLRKLRERQIAVRDERVRRFVSREGGLSAVEFESGTRISISGLFFTLDTKHGATLAQDLGCAMDLETDSIKVDEDRKTTVKGVYAIGDITAGPKLVVKAAADGAIAALAVHKSLD